jgi:AcrR family transcriptional regulator
MTATTSIAPSSPDFVAVRDRVLAAAREEFAARGLHAASVRTIGKGAGVTGAMINYYFRSKRALYDAVVAEAQGRLMARLAEALRGSSKTNAPARLAGAYFDFLAEEVQLQRLLLRQVLDRDENVRAVTADFVRPLRALLEAHFGAGEDAVQGAISLFGAVAGYFIYEPVLGPFLDMDPLSTDALTARRKHVVRLASMLERSRK